MQLYLAARGTICRTLYQRARRHLRIDPAARLPQRRLLAFLLQLFFTQLAQVILAFGVITQIPLLGRRQ